MQQKGRKFLAPAGGSSLRRLHSMAGQTVKAKSIVEERKGLANGHRGKRGGHRFQLGPNVRFQMRRPVCFVRKKMKVVERGGSPVMTGGGSSAETILHVGNRREKLGGDYRLEKNRGPHAEREHAIS